MEHLTVDQWNRDGTVQHLIVEKWNTHGGTVEQWNILCWNSSTSGGEKWNNRSETVEHLLVKLGNV